MSRLHTLTFIVVDEGEPDALLEQLEDAQANSEIVLITPIGKASSTVLVQGITAEPWTRVTSEQVFG